MTGDKKGSSKKKDETKTVATTKSVAFTSDTKKKATDGTTKDTEAPSTGPVTTEEDHRRNMKRLAEIRKRREEAEARHLAEEETICSWEKSARNWWRW